MTDQSAAHPADDADALQPAPSDGATACAAVLGTLGADRSGVVDELRGPTGRGAAHADRSGVVEELRGPTGRGAAHEAERRAHASQRIHVEHGISHLKNWRALSRHLGRREHLDMLLPAVAGLVSSQERAPRPDQFHRAPNALPADTAA